MGDMIKYTIRQQDDTLVVMSVPDTKEMRLFVDWVKKYEAAQDQFNAGQKEPGAA